MVDVVTLAPRRPGKRTQLLIEALAYEKTADPDEPIIVIVETATQKMQVSRQLQCMVGARLTRIEVLTTTEVAARRQRQKEQGNGV